VIDVWLSWQLRRAVLNLLVVQNLSLILAAITLTRTGEALLERAISLSRHGNNFDEDTMFGLTTDTAMQAKSPETRFVWLVVEDEEPDFYLMQVPLRKDQTCAAPPSTKTSAPVMKLLSSLARKSATAAVSSG
jgi:hypothetical protein